MYVLNRKQQFIKFLETNRTTNYNFLINYDKILLALFSLFFIEHINKLAYSMHKKSDFLACEYLIYSHFARTPMVTQNIIGLSEYSDSYFFGANFSIFSLNSLIIYITTTDNCLLILVFSHISLGVQK